MSQVARFAVDTVGALSALVKEGKWLQCLVVLYSAIDTLAWSTVPQGDVRRTDFISWVERYMRPQEQLGCTAADLYAARCGLLHSSSAQSRMSRSGEATELWYATSEDRVPQLQGFAERKGANAKVVGITPLVQAFADGSQAFVEQLADDPSLEATVSRRIRAWLGFFASPNLDH
jgi:hypothetical protein